VDQLKRTPVTSGDTFAALITMEPEDYVALQRGGIVAEQLAEAHHGASRFLRDAGL
jgi:methylphosphotriester-DNA--protein-cysteine methyltransferase